MEPRPPAPARGRSTRRTVNTPKGGQAPRGDGDRRREVTHLKAYKVEEIAELLGVGRDKIYELIRTRQLHSIKIGRSRRITEQQLADFITSLEQVDQD
ncbi:helix-turn-helix domain-containing protein [Nonomuraea sp. PA05]|uniref:helix-turn-helix domain-containing protein n=1 Tax=Nonomuraea sp. PA05 TaxID=2604466 RepID=UPI00292A4290|nr:helix-turn-helix domain-containing protein [Nonomuraea sp. PA05]